MDIERLLELAALAIDVGDDELAIKTLTVLLAQAPDHPVALWQIARYYGLKGAYAEAAEQYRRAVRRDPALSLAVFRVGGHTITLRDVAGSTMPALVLEEFGQGMYGLQQRRFAAGDVVLDIGAHIGAVSILIAKQHPQVRVIAYEPSSSNYAMLVANLAANEVHNVVAVREAVAGVAGTLELVWSPTETAGATANLAAGGRQQLVDAGWSTESVPCVTLDDIFAQHAIERCAFLKLDCEGAEWEIVRRATAIERVDSMALELHVPESRRGEGVGALQQEFAALLMNRPRYPEAVVSSTVWVRHA
jgi:FkbM family methyltransferase